MIGDLFDSPWKILIVAVVLIVLFGSKKLPHAARSLGQSMRILKREVQGLHEDETVPGGPSPAQTQASAAAATGFPQAELAAPPKPDQQAQIDALHRRYQEEYGQR
jgi:sec-independent protein translocase protein TatA